MRLSIVILSFCVVVVFCHWFPVVSANASPGQNATSVTEEQVGTWRLVSVETVRPCGEVIYSFYVEHPEALSMYDRSGWTSVQIVSDPKPTVPLSSSCEGFLAAPTNEKVSAAEGHYAYFGTWTVDLSGATVTHHIRESLYPGERGEEGARRLFLQRNRLTLTPTSHEMGEEHERGLIWERVLPAHQPANDHLFDLARVACVGHITRKTRVS